MIKKQESPPWIDISVPLASGMVVWPDNPTVEIDRAQDMGEGADANVTRLNMGAHTGTHMDAPIHFIEGAVSLDRMPLSAGIGEARVISLPDTDVIRPDDLQDKGIRKNDRVLFRTRNSDTNWVEKPFIENFVYLSTEAAAFLVGIGVRLIGIDYLSVSGYQKNEKEVHELLLKAGIWIIEGLYMPEVLPGHYELICLPIKIAGSDGAPARAVLRPITVKD